MRKYAIPAVVVALGVATYLVGTSMGWITPLVGAPKGPVLDCPNLVDLGEVEVYTVPVGHFRVTNSGDQELVLNKIRLGCQSCTGLYQERGGRSLRINELRLRANESADLSVRLAVNGPVGAPIQTAIYFMTNEPGVTERQLRIVVRRVKGGVETFPREVVFGWVLVGAETRQVVEITDESANPRTIDRIISGTAEAVTVRELPLNTPSELYRKGKVIGRFEVILDTRKPQSIANQVQIYISGRETPTIVPVAAKVCAPVEISPTILSLPRRSEVGLIYRASCVCRSVDGKPFVLRVAECPKDISVHIPERADETLSRVVDVTWHVRGKRDDNVRSVRLTAQVGEIEIPLEISVLCRAEEP